MRSSRPYRIDRIVGYVFTQCPLLLLPRRSAQQVRLPRGWGRLWPPRLTRDTAWQVRDGRRVWLTPRQLAVLQAQARALGWGPLLIVPGPAPGTAGTAGLEDVA